MSAAAAAAPAEGAPPKKGKKKLIIIIAAVVLLAGGGGGGYYMMMKKKAEAAAAAAAEDGEEAAPAHAPAAKHDPKSPPTYVPLEPFVVNLADRDADRFAQIGVTLEVDDAKFADQMKVYMPAIRNGILMTLAHKSSAQLLERSGKDELAAEIMREAVRPMGIEIDDEDSAHDEEDAPKSGKKKKRKKKREVHNPVTNVLFSNFIIQ
jgi:flagellar protein FliL